MYPQSQAVYTLAQIFELDLEDIPLERCAYTLGSAPPFHGVVSHAALKLAIAAHDALDTLTLRDFPHSESTTNLMSKAARRKIKLPFTPNDIAQFNTRVQA